MTEPPSLADDTADVVVVGAGHNALTLDVEGSMEPETVSPHWLTWPAGVVAVLAWALGRLTQVAFFDLVAVTALAWLGGWLVSNLLGRYLTRSGQLPADTDDPPEADGGR